MKASRILVCAFAVATSVAVAAAGRSVPSQAGGQPRISQKSVAGIAVTAQRTGVQDVVVLRGSLPAGEIFNPPGNPALAMMVAGMLDKGTVGKTKASLSSRLADIGATVSFSADAHMTTFSAKFLREDLATVIAVLADELHTPAFPADELEVYKKQLEARLRRQFEDTDFVAANAFTRAVYPATHPNHGASLDELIAAIRGTTVEDLKKFHAQHYGPSHMNLVAVGDLDISALHAQVAKSFSGWRGGHALPRASAGEPVAARGERPVVMPGKTSVSVAWGMATGLRWNDPDALALRVGTTIFGSGFAGRLMATVRDKEGLTYKISAGAGNDVFTTGEWRISGSFAPELLDQGLASTRRQLELWIRDGVTAEELASNQRKLITGAAIVRATPDGLASALLDAIHRGPGPAYLQEYPRQIQALTLEDVNDAIRRHIRPDDLVLVKVGTLPGSGAAPKPAVKQ